MYVGDVALSVGLRKDWVRITMAIMNSLLSCAYPCFLYLYLSMSLSVCLSVCLFFPCRVLWSLSVTRM